MNNSMTQMSQTARLIGQGVENLNAHGIPNIQRAKSSYRKCFWILASLASLSIFTLHCVNNIDRFWKYDITVNYDIRFETVVEFPAITICNLNPVKESVSKTITDLDNFLGSSTNTARPMKQVSLLHWLGQHNTRPVQMFTNTPVPSPRPTKVWIFPKRSRFENKKKPIFNIMSKVLICRYFAPLTYSKKQKRSTFCFTFYPCSALLFTLLTMNWSPIAILTGDQRSLILPYHDKRTQVTY